MGWRTEPPDALPGLSSFYGFGIPGASAPGSQRFAASRLYRQFCGRLSENEAPGQSMTSISMHHVTDREGKFTDKI